MANIIRTGGGSGGSSSVIVSKSITDNGTYYASSDNADGYNPVIVSVSGGSVTTLALHSGKINMNTGAIIADSDYYYSDLIDAPNGYMVFDFGEPLNETNVGVEMCTSNGAHSNYYSYSGRFRRVNHATYYSQAPKIRLSFRASNLNFALLNNNIDGTTYTATPIKLEVSNN